MSRRDVVIVGAGPTGLLVSERLAQAGLSHVVLEAGFASLRPLPHDRARFANAVRTLVRVDPRSWAFRAEGGEHEWQRVRAAGGRSLLWGGWCVRPEPRILRDAEMLEAPWPLSFAEIERYVRRAERRLGVRAARIGHPLTSLREVLGIPVVPKRAAVHESRERPLVATDWGARRNIISGAIAVRVLLDDNLAARGVEYLDAKTRSLHRIEASAVVLAASPIETARLLVSSDPAGALPGRERIGARLVDHQVASYLLIVSSRPRAEEEPRPLERAALVPRFVNLGDEIDRDYRSGFSVEVRGPAPARLLPSDVRKAIDLDDETAREASTFQIHAIGELPPSPLRRLSFDSTTCDDLGRPIPVIHAEFGAEEERMARDMDETCVAIADALAPDGGRVIPFRRPLRPALTAHEAGTCPMGRDPRSSVTDPFGAVHGTRGLYVADASVMPTALDRHPTLTVLALALRTADRLVDRLRHGD